MKIEVRKEQMNKTFIKLIFILFITAVISFKYKDVETNFNLEKKEKEITVKVLINNEVKTLNLEDYIIGETLGEGTFGKVKLARHKITKEKVN